jgi:hypothetical protein
MIDPLPVLLTAVRQRIASRRAKPYGGQDQEEPQAGAAAPP